MSVSYTHLDVYKRQVLYSTVRNNWFSHDLSACNKKAYLKNIGLVLNTCNKECVMCITHERGKKKSKLCIWLLNVTYTKYMVYQSFSPKGTASSTRSNSAKSTSRCHYVLTKMFLQIVDTNCLFRHNLL